MKSLIVSLALIACASSAFAGDSKVIASITNLNGKVQGVTLTEDGVVNVILRERHAPIVKHLSQASAERLGWLASSLSNAQITTEHHTVVCMIMVNPMFMPYLSIAQYDETSGEWKDGALKTVLTTSNCGTPTATFPEERGDFANATALKEVLDTLATEATASLN